MAGVDGIAPPLRESESPVPLLYETPNCSAILSPQAGTVKPLQWLHIKFTTCLLKSDTEAVGRSSRWISVGIALNLGWGTGIRTQTDGFRGQRVLETLVLTTTLFPKNWYRWWDSNPQNLGS